jgi:hypothetical protein
MGQTDDEREDDDDEYYYLNFWYGPISDHVVSQMRQEDMGVRNEDECDMCGKQNNPRLRPGGSKMCSTCWTIWNG